MKSRTISFLDDCSSLVTGLPALAFAPTHLLLTEPPEGLCSCLLKNAALASDSLRLTADGIRMACKTLHDRVLLRPHPQALASFPRLSAHWLPCLIGFLVSWVCAKTFRVSVSLHLLFLLSEIDLLTFPGLPI